MNWDNEYTIELMFVLIALIASFIIWLYKKKRDVEREKEFLSYCQSNNLEYNHSLSKYSKRFETIKDSVMFNKGNPQEFLYEIAGNFDGIEFSIFSFKYYISDGDGKNEFYDTVCVLKKSDISLPDFFVREKDYFEKKSSGTAFSKILDFFNKPINKLTAKETEQEVVFKDDKAFSSFFLVKGNNVNKIKQLFNKDLRNNLIRNHSKGCQYNSLNDYFIISQFGYLNLKERLAFLKRSIDIYALFF